MPAGLAKLHLGPATAIVFMISIILGGLINVPVKRIVRQEDVVLDPFAVLGFRGLFLELRRTRDETIIAVDLGGCVIPAGIAIYQLIYLSALGGDVVLATLLACVLNSVVDYFVAHPEPDVGIMMPGLLSPVIAASLAFDGIVLPGGGLITVSSSVDLVSATFASVAVTAALAG